MSFNLNDQIRRQGNRSRAIPATPPIPDIGQGATPASPAVQQMQGAGPQAPSAPPPMPTGEMAAAPPPGGMRPPQPQRPPTPFMIHPPGQPADPNHYNYEPQNDGSWRVYPPGIQAPHGAFTTSMPRAASTADYARMSQTLARTMYGG